MATLSVTVLLLGEGPALIQDRAKRKQEPVKMSLWTCSYSDTHCGSALAASMQRNGKRVGGRCILVQLSLL